MTTKGTLLSIMIQHHVDLTEMPLSSVLQKGGFVQGLAQFGELSGLQEGHLLHQCSVI